MITPPPTAEPPQLGPLPAPSEGELVAAYPELHNHALTLPWAAERLGLQPSRLEALARAGELLVIPGPWPMRQADYPGLFVPAWQLQPGGRGPYPQLPVLLAAAAVRRWTSLDLHRFMTTPLDEVTPAALLRAGNAAQVAALIRSHPRVPPIAEPTQTRRRRHPRIALRAPHRAGSRPHLPQAAGTARPPREGGPPSAGRRPRAARAATTRGRR